MPKTRQQRRARARNPLSPKRRGRFLFLGFITLIVGLGGFGIWQSRANPPPLTRGASIGEHWHASLRIYICGQRVTNFPNLEGELHSHADGFMHIHPHTQTFAGPNATVGAFLGTYQTSIEQAPDGANKITFPDGTSYEDGEKCKGDDEEQELEATNKGEPIGGNPASFIPHDGDAVVLKFGPEGEKPLPNPYAQAAGLPDPGFGPDATPAPDSGATPPAEPAESPTATKEPDETPAPD